jgi:hypothetical protein
MNPMGLTHFSKASSQTERLSQDGAASRPPAGRGELAPGLRSLLKTWFPKLPLLVCIALFIFHFSVIRKYAVNLPFYDDWVLFRGDNHPASVDLPWLYAQHNEHRTATTKLFVWLQFQLNGWNVGIHQLIDFLIYGLFLVLLVLFVRKWAPQVPVWILLSFIVFFLSPIIWLQHLMAYVAAVHFWVLFFIVAVYFLFTESQKWPAIIVGGISAILSTYSFASGFVTSFILLVAFGLFKCIRTRQATGERNRRREVLQLLIVVALIGGALAGWIVGFHKPSSHHPPLTLPYKWAFWLYLANLVSFSFGVDRISAGIGILCLLTVLTPVCGIVWKRRGKLLSLPWPLLAVVLGILADQCSVTIGRAGFGIWQSKTMEYAEHGMPLIILSVASWGILLQHRERLRFLAITTLWLFCLISFSNNWDFGFYETEQANRLEGRRCILAYYNEVGDGNCPTIYSRPIPEFFTQAKRLNASFYRDLQSEIRPETADNKRLSGESGYFGFHDVADCQHIAGWAMNRSRPYTAIKVAIYDDDKLLATVPADLFRPDILQAGFASGRSGFDFPTPEDLKDGRTHQISVRFSNTNLDLQASSKLLSCAPP